MQYLPLDLKIALVSVFLQVGLTFFAMIRVALLRVRAVKSGAAKIGDIALSSAHYPEAARRHGNNLANQFEFPVLLYVAVILAAQFNVSSMPFALACLAYVVTRILHRFIHVTTNDVVQRFQVFLTGIVLLALAWLFLIMGFFGVIAAAAQG
ncbi:MAG: MAPEG family protein [Paracoccaceae bacterium]